jgi:hypothetical protein
MKKLKHILLATALASAATAGWAQDKATLIKQFLDIQKPAVEMMARGIVQSTSDPVAAAASEYLSTRVAADKRDAAAKAADEEFRKYFDATFPIVRDKAAQVFPGVVTPILEQDFTEDELKTLMAWLNSPVSRKFAETSGKMQQALGQKIIGDLRPTLEPKVEKLNVDVAKAIGAPTDGGQAAAPKSGGAKAPAKK